MANTSRNLLYSTAEYTRIYPGFRGIELNASSSITDSSRLAYSENMYRDYEADGADVIESIPGFRKLFGCGKNVHALYYQRSATGNDHLIVHAEGALMRFPVEEISRGEGALSEPIATLRNAKSFGFSYGQYFYVIDGESILQIDETGHCRRVSDGDAAPYVPTTYISGEKYEERNLLTDLFKEEFYITDPSGFYYSTNGLKYTITDQENKLCSVSGIDEGVSGDLFIPSRAVISDEEYKVISIDSYAFAKNTDITSVTISEGVEKIGLFAFQKCTNITEIIIPSSVSVMDNGAFIDCAKLETLYIGAGMSDIGIASFAGCPLLKNVYYALDAESYGKILNIEGLNGKSVTYETKPEGITLALKMHDDTREVSTVCVNGSDYEFNTQTKGNIIEFITLRFNSPSDATGIKVEVYGALCEKREDFGKSGDKNGLTGYEAITSCTIAEVFDGRIFFSGNPTLPNTVFYTDSKNAGNGANLYVGCYNYFNDGVGGYNVKSMLAVRDMLAVFKEGDDGTGSIFYHKKENLASDTLSAIYPVAYVHSGICASGRSHSFLDDPVFITPDGLYALESQNINYQRNLGCRSHNVNFRLLKEDLSNVNLCTWLGYLVIGACGNAYLADSRVLFRHPGGSNEYEWFFLTGIGTYKNDFRVYRYSDEEYSDAIAHPAKKGAAADPKNVFSSQKEDGTLYYYSVEDGVKYLLYPTDEMCGGEFSPAKVFISHGKYLFFATESGDVCVFNNDKRGVAPNELQGLDEFDSEAYAAEMSDKIHPIYYGFAGHAPRYEIRTALDNCGIPHLTKNTVKNSLIIKARSYVCDSIRCDVLTDRGDVTTVGRFPAINTGFDELSFDTAPWVAGKYTSTSLPERQKRWIEKQIILSSDRYCSPISVHSISYRYQIKGKIKNN